MLAQKPMPDRSSTGSARNKGSDGRMNQKMLDRQLGDPLGVAVSRHSHIIASSEVSGSDATSPPQPG